METKRSITKLRINFKKLRFELMLLSLIFRFTKNYNLQPALILLINKLIIKALRFFLRNMGLTYIEQIIT